ncbi:hypothetical protein CF326_g6970 [Tilletia indica]|nr:hypothetical protein CF326_g6970 [Tilletia indica]
MSDTPARNTRSSGPTMDEFRALESGQATLGQNLNDQLATLRNKQASDMDEVRAQIHSVSTEQNARFDELQTSINTILRLQGRSSNTDDTSSTAPQVSQPATADTPSVVPATSSTEAPSSTSRPVEMESSASATGGGVATVSAVPTKQTYNIKSDDISTFDGTPENLELFLARVQAVRFAENDASWDRAVLRAIPLALRGRAAIWHSTLTDRQRSNLFRIDSWFEALRENFSPHPAIVRRQARERAWEYEVEDILGYVFAKVALLKVAYPGLKEGEVVQEVAERLPVEIQMLLRQPHEHQPSLVKFRAELRVQEVFWRVRYNRPLVTATGEESESTPSKKRTSTFAELVAPSTLAMTPASPSFARGSVAQRRGKPYSEDFDPSRIGQGKSPRTGKDTMFYRVPDTADTIWCERPCRRCGANHFDFAHEHFTTRPQVRFAEEEEDDGYPAASYAAESNDRGDSQSF